MTSFTLFASIVVTVVGVGAFSYPRELTEAVGTDGWVVTIISGCICIGILYLINYIVKTNNYQDIASILINTTGKLSGSIFSFIIVAFGIFTISIGMRIFSEVVKMYLLEKTPTEFILLVMLLVSTYIVRKGIEVLGKFNEVAFWIMFIPIVFIILALYKVSDYSNIFPVFHNKPIQYIKSISKSIYSFAGIEVAYLFIPIMHNKEKAMKTCIKSIAFITVFYIIIIVTSLSVFSKEGVKQLLWPTITMVKCIDIPGTFIERWDGLAMALWVMFYFTTCVNILSFSSNIVKDVFKFPSVKISLYFLLPVIYIIALFPNDISQISSIVGIFEPIFAILVYLFIPLIILFMGFIRKRG